MLARTREGPPLAGGDSRLGWSERSAGVTSSAVSIVERCRGADPDPFGMRGANEAAGACPFAAASGRAGTKLLPLPRGLRSLRIESRAGPELLQAGGRALGSPRVPRNRLGGASGSVVRC